MIKLEELKRVVDRLQAEVDEYFEGHRTKAVSKNIRMQLGELKKSTTSIRKELIEADKE